MEVNDKYFHKIVLTDDIVDLESHVKLASVTVNGNSVLNAINLHNNLNLKIKLEKKSTLTLNLFDFAIINEVKLDIELDDEATLILNGAFIAEEKYGLDIDVKLYGSDTSVSINIRGINEENATTKIIMNGTLAGETKNSRIDEYAKVINKSDASAILIPNLIVNTNEVEANHGVSIGSIDKNEIFYLMSKGLSLEDATKIIEEGFLVSIMSDSEKKRIQNILVGR